MKSTVEVKKGKGEIVFVHGAWHGAWCWDKYFVKLFSDKGYTCITFDLPKHDKSGKIKGINKLTLHDYVNALKDEVNKLDKAPIIVGHSMGGLIVQKYLETETCEKAVLLASVPPSGVLRTALEFLKHSYGFHSLVTMNLFGLVNTLEKSKRAFFSIDMPNKEVEEYSEKLCSESFTVFLNMLYPNIKVNNHLKIPTLVLGAANDTIFTVKENERTAKKYGADLIIMEDIAHDMMLEVKHEEVANEIINWIEKSDLKA